jgi:hypothetical protein
MDLPRRMTVWAVIFILLFGFSLSALAYKTSIEISEQEARIEQSTFEIDDMQRTLNHKQTPPLPVQNKQPGNI